MTTLPFKNSLILESYRKTMFCLLGAISVLPNIWLLGMISYYVRARLYLGYWPLPSQPDPKQLPFDAHYSLVAIHPYIILASIVVFPVVRNATKRIDPVTARRFSYFFGFGILSLFLFFWIPKINFVMWFMD